MIKMNFLGICILLVSGFISAQEELNKEYVRNTYSSTRIINGHSTETLEKKTLEFRIEHRFGDMFYVKDDGMWAADAQNFMGFDNAADIRFGFEYGITDNIMIGLGRNKGTGAPYRSLIDGFAKYRLLRQQEKGIPISMTVIGSSFFTYMNKVDDLTQVTSFPKWQHRFSYSLQFVVARKFGKWFSMSLSPTLVHRNYVQDYDQNTQLALGGATRFAVAKKVGIIVEYFYTFRGENPHFFDRNNPNIFRNSLGLAVEFETFGHNFTINFTNSKGFGEAQYIPYTYSDWLLGEFRLGFCIGRKFNF